MTRMRSLMHGLILTLAPIVFVVAPALAQDIPVPTPRPDPGASAPQMENQSDATQREDLPIIHREICPALRTGQVEGQMAAPIRQGECGEDSPLKLTKVEGVAVTGDPLTRCGMADGLARFTLAAKEAAQEILGTELKAIITGPGYECRRRNRAATGKMSEHAFANALDIAGFEMANGKKVLVEADWPHLPPKESSGGEENTQEEPATDTPAKPAPPPASERASTPAAKYLVAVRDKACSIFSTVLSPDSNTAHHAHLHFDLGCHGKTCTYLICE